jgi:hypothetical protein
MTEDNNNELELFEKDDLVFAEKNGEFIGGGYKIAAAFLEGGMPIMTTMNNDDNETETDMLIGGKKNVSSTKVSSAFENLAVPAGLFFINSRVPKANMRQLDAPYQTISDDIMDKLYSLVEANKKQKKTRKHSKPSNNKKTRRHKRV